MDEQEVDTQVDVDTDTEEESSQPSVQYSNVAKNPYVELASAAFLDYKKKRQEENTQTAQILKQAQDVLLARANPENSPEMYFRLAAAFGKPTRTGAFGESLGYANEALAEEAARREKYRQAYEETKLKYQLQQAQLPAQSAKENVDYATKMARIPQPKGSRSEYLALLDEYKGMPDTDPNKVRLGKYIESFENRYKGNRTTEKFDRFQWAIQTLTNKDSTQDQKNLAMSILPPPKKPDDKKPSYKDKAFEIIQQHWNDVTNGNPPSVNPKVLQDAYRIVYGEKIGAGDQKPKTPQQEAWEIVQNPDNYTDEEVKNARLFLRLDPKEKVSDTKPPSPREAGTIYTDKHLARAAQEIFGNALVPDNKDDREKVEKRAAQYRNEEKNQRIEEKRQSRPPPREPKPKDAPIDLTLGQATAERLGVPFNDAPYRGVNDKVAGQLLVSNTKAAQKALSKVEADASKTLKLDSDVNRFLAANKKAPTGRERSLLPSFGEDYQTMESIQASMAPENRKEGTGAVSDFDAKQLIKMSLSIQNNYQTNINIGLALKAANQMARDKAKFLSDYFQANRHLDGAEAAWMRYATANPIFDRNNPNQLNQRRMTYKQFFYPPQQRARGGYMGYSDLATLRNKYAHGGAVRMQEGGNPVDSVVRLKPMEPGSDTTNRARAFFGQGMGMSFGDEAEALYRSFGDRNKSYDQYLNEIRADYRRFAEQNPGQALGFEFAGGIAPTVGAMFIPGGQAKTATDLARAPGIFRKALEYSTKTPTRRMVTSGAGYGAVSGFGAGEGGIGNRLLEAGESGLLGAVTAPIIGKGGELLYQGGKGIYKRLTKPGTNIIDEQAYAKVLEKMRQDNMTPQQAIRQVALERGEIPWAGPIGTRPNTKLRDVSLGLTDLAEAVAQRPGAGRKKMTKSVVETGRGTKGRVMNMAGEHMAGGKTMFQTETELTDALRSNADTLYENAYKFGTVKDPRILDMLNQPQFKQAYQQVLETNKIRKANAIAQGKDPSKYDMKEIYKITETQPGIYQIDLVAAPDVRTLDQMKRGLDYIIRSGRRSENAAAQDAAHALNEYKNTFLNVLDEVVPAYGVARQQYRGDLEVLDALDIGRSQYSKMSPEEATSYVSKLTPTERDAVRIGYAQFFKDRIGNAKNSINAAEEILGAENNAARLRALFDTQGEYDVFRGILKVESRNVKNAQQVGQGSATGRRKQLAKEFESDSTAAQMLDLAGGSPFNTFMRIIKKAPDLFKDEQVASKVADILNTGKAADLGKLLRELESRADRFAREAAKREAIGGTFSKATGRMMGETPIGADYVEPEVNIPSSVEGENTGVIIPEDYVPEPDEPEAEETVIIQEADEPEDREQMRRGGMARRKKLRMQEGGDIPDPYSLKEILRRSEVSAMMEDMRDRQMKTSYGAGRVGYRHPVGDDREVGLGVSGMHSKYDVRTPEGQRFSGKKSAVTGVDASYGDKRNQLYMKYGLPVDGKKMRLAEAGYSRNLDNDRGTVGIRHSQLSPEGFPDRRTQLYYSREFRKGGAVSPKAMGSIVRKMYK